VKKVLKCKLEIKKIINFMEFKRLINAGNTFYLFKKLLLFYLC